MEIEGTDVSDFLAPAKVVLHLLKPYLNKGYTVGIDNLYTDPRLFEVLLENGTDAIGTVRANKRYLPNGIKVKRLQRGYCRFWYKIITKGKKGIMCVMWQDKKTVRLMSTIHGNAMKEVDDRVKGKKTGKKSKPNACIEYKQIMPGVDKMDQMMASYDPTRKRLKRYWRRMYLTLLEMAYYNSFVVFNSLAEKKLSYLSYKIDVIKKTCEKYGHRFYKSANGPVPYERFNPDRRESISECDRLVQGEHFPVEIGVNAGNRKIYRQCHFCAKQTVKSTKTKDIKTSNIKCFVCKCVLCVTPCFHLYHTLKDYTIYEEKKQRVCHIFWPHSNNFLHDLYNLKNLNIFL